MTRTTNVKSYKRKDGTRVKAHKRKVPDDYYRDYYPQDHYPRTKRQQPTERVCSDCEGQGYAGPMWDQTICKRCGGDGTLD